MRVPFVAPVLIALAFGVSYPSNANAENRQFDHVMKDLLTAKVALKLAEKCEITDLTHMDALVSHTDTLLDEAVVHPENSLGPRILDYMDSQAEVNAEQHPCSDEITTVVQQLASKSAELQQR